MSGSKCVYFRCGKSRRSHPGLRMFRFPLKDETRLEIWLQNAGIPISCKLGLDGLKNKELCIEHFDPIFILPSGHLRRDAIPIPASLAHSTVHISTAEETFDKPPAANKISYPDQSPYHQCPLGTPAGVVHLSGIYGMSSYDLESSTVFVDVKDELPFMAPIEPLSFFEEDPLG